MREIEYCLHEIVQNKDAEHIGVCVGVKDRILFEAYNSPKLNEDTKFDMASVTKMLSTTMLTLIALDKGLLHLDDRVERFFKVASDRTQMTIKNLLTHTIGFGNISISYEMDKGIYQNVTELFTHYPLEAAIGSRVAYSCPGFIILGMILEKIFDDRLDILFRERVAMPLGMKDSSYLPADGAIVNSNLAAEMCGIVNDNNCRYLGGVAGNAGVFSNMKDMKKFAFMLTHMGAPLISKDTFEQAIQNHTAGIGESRGLGFLYVDETYEQTGSLFLPGAIGHCGHTGQSLFADPKSGLFAIILSDMTVSNIRKNGALRYDEVMKNRAKIHNAIRKAL